MASSAQRELLVDGPRRNYEEFAALVRQALATTSDVALPVHSTGDAQVSRFIIRAGAPPNRVS
jgi:hypothetical protein